MPADFSKASFAVRTLWLLVGTVTVPLVMVVATAAVVTALSIQSLQIAMPLACFTATTLGAGTLVITRVFRGFGLFWALVVYVAAMLVLCFFAELGVACHFGNCL